MIQITYQAYRLFCDFLLHCPKVAAETGADVKLVGYDTWRHSYYQEN
jgi:hypothetical protein